MASYNGQYIVDSNVEGEKADFQLEGFRIDEDELPFFHDDYEFELEKNKVKNIRKKVAFYNEIIDHDTTTFYHFPKRSNFEVRGGYKIAKHRQRLFFSVLHNVKVFNLFFRFINSRTNTLDTSAMMVRPRHVNEEWVLLLPDDTKLRIINEVQMYGRIASSMVLDPDIQLDPDYQSEILENLRMLSTPERCAQSLLHEYGHILHWRMFDALRLLRNDEIYLWFFDEGYAEIIDKRSPEFAGASVEDKVYFLKESLAEDYRIWLNMNDKRDKFILPNLNTFYADFYEPSLLNEGVTIMKKMLSKAISGQATLRKQGFSQEPDRVATATRVLTAAKKANWIPGQSRMTREDHINVVRELERTTSDYVIL